MAYSITKNQIFRFTPLSACKCGASFCQLVEGQDEIMLQGKVTPSTQEQLVLDGDFAASTNWTLGDDWVISGGKLTGTVVDSGNTASTIAPIGLKVGSIYSIRIKATFEMIVGTLADVDPGEGWRVAINDDYFPLEDETLGFSKGSKIASFTYTPTSITSDNIVFSGNKISIPYGNIETWRVIIDYIEVYELSRIGVALYDTDLNLISDEGELSSPNVITYRNPDGSQVNNSPYPIEGEFDVTELYAYWQIFIENLDTITNDRGCMFLQIYDFLFGLNYERISNGDFATADLSYWSAGEYWGYDTGGALYSPPVSGAYIAGTLCQTVYLMGGNRYILSFFLSNVSISGAMQVLIDYNDGGGSTQLLTGTGVGTKGATIDLTNLTGLQEITLCFAELVPNEDFKIDNVTVKALASNAGSYSNCINVQDEHSCTLITRASNNDNAYGFIYTNTGFRQRMRFYGKKKYNDYVEDVEPFVFSDRSRILAYAATDKSYTVTVGDASEHMHDHLRLSRLHDDFRITEKLEDGTIEQVTYVINGGYELGQRKSSDNSTATFNVFEQQGIPANYSCE